MIDQELQAKTKKISVIGLGYVGMPLAVAFSKTADVIGFDTNTQKIQLYKSGVDPTQEVGDAAVSSCSVRFTDRAEDLKEASFHIVAVPTPINQDKTPDLNPVISASEILARNLTKGSIVVYESTVYPGVTEDICVPVLERISGLCCGKDFKVGYSPERINPGDRVHTLETITKIVSGTDAETLEEIAKVYELVVKAGVFRAASIKVAEAAKVVENSQRDINIAFMNELAMVFDKMGIDSNDVIDAMNTKWNALGFKPGLVGGHCIGVDPYYFVYEAQKLGYHSQIIASGRKINDGMGQFVAESCIKEMIAADKKILNAKVSIFGLTFKENCPDVRNTKVIDIIKTLESYGVECVVFDPFADPQEAERLYGIRLAQDESSLKNSDALILAVAHQAFSREASHYVPLFRSTQPASCPILDVKGILSREQIKRYPQLRGWRL